jgi:chaperonin GroES
MWKIENPLSLDHKEDGRPIWALADVTHLLGEDDLQQIGRMVWDGFTKDKLSRAKWEKRTQAAMDLALQVQKGKTFPWPGCSNVMFPLVSISALQFHSRAYPSLVSGTDIVKYRTVGADPQGKEAQRARRIGEHMSFQILEEDHAWEEQHDRMLLSVPIVGCAFKKTYFSPAERANVSDLVLAQDLVMDYYAKSVESAARKTQILPMDRNEIYSGVVEGRLRDVLDEQWYHAAAQPIQYEPGPARADNRKGQTPPMSPDEDTPYTTLEQHRRLDLDGDGYAEPWIVTIESGSRQVIRIVAGWDSEKQMERSIHGRLSRIHSTEYYTKYGFIPSPDGGVYDLGFGVLLGPINSSVNAILNQLIDAGTLATTSGGFLARGAKIRGGQYQFTQFGWNRVDATGDDLKKSIFPMPVREPSPVLFQVLSFLVQYAQRLGASTDALVGENPGQNTPAQTQQSMVEQGMKIYSALFKRMWRCMKHEFEKLYALNAIYMPDQVSYGAAGALAQKQDYLGDPRHIAPAADPNVSSDLQQYQRALTIKQAAASTPGYDLEAVERNFLRSLKVDGAEALYPGPQKVPPLPNPRASLEQMKQQGQMQREQSKQQAELRKFALQFQEQQKLNRAQIMQIEAQALKLMADADSAKVGKEVAAMNAMVGALKAHDESLRAHVDQVMKALESDRDFNSEQATHGAGMAGMANPSGHTSPVEGIGAAQGGF